MEFILYKIIFLCKNMYEKKVLDKLVQASREYQEST